jgi:Flp pilus assembly protein TadD
VVPAAVAPTEPAVNVAVRETTTAPVVESAPAGARAPREAPSGRATGARTVDHFALAQEALQARRFEVAVSEALAAIGARQRPVEARNLLGLAYLRSGQRAQAVAQWRLVLAREPGNAQARTYLRAAGEDPDTP